MNLFSSLTHTLSAGDRVMFSIEALKGGNMSVLVVSQLDSDYEIDNEEIDQLRAALSVPLRVVGSPEELDSGFFGKLSEYQKTRAKVSEQMDVCFKIKETAKQAASKKTSSPPAPEPKKEADPSPVMPESMVGASNPDSFI